MNVGDVVKVTSMDTNVFNWSGEIYAFVEQPPTPPGIHYTLLVVTGWYQVKDSTRVLSAKMPGHYFSLTGKKTGGMDWCTVPPEDVPGHVWGELGRLQLTGGN